MNADGLDITTGHQSWSIMPEEFSRHFMYFLHLVPRGQLLSGERAREFFLQTNIPPLNLGHIWQLSDIDGDGCLDAAEFCMAMCLVHHWLSGAHLPSSLPLPLSSLYRDLKWPHLPPASEEHILKCHKVFEVFQKNVKTGKMIGNAAKYLLNKSNLSVEQLHHIWILSDKDCDGKLSFSEFLVAMHLVFLAKVGFVLPLTLDHTSVLPPSFQHLADSGTNDDRDPDILNNEAPYSSTPLGVPVQNNNNNCFTSEDFVDLPTSHFQDTEYKSSPGNPFLPSADSAYLSKADGYLTEACPQTSVVSLEEPSTSYMDLGNGQSSYSNPSQLSVIPEEALEDDKERRGAGHCKASPSHQSGKGEEGLPRHWHDNNSLDFQQTIPEDRSDEGRGAKESSAKLMPARPIVKKVVVTEDIIPRLQVAMAVKVDEVPMQVTSGLGDGNKGAEPASKDKAGLANPKTQRSILKSEDVGRKVLSATTNDKDYLSNTLHNVAHSSNPSRILTKPAPGVTTALAEIESKHSLEILRALDKLESEILLMTMMADDISEDDQEMGVAKKVSDAHKSPKISPRSNDLVGVVSPDRVHVPAAPIPTHKKTRVHQLNRNSCLDPNTSSSQSRQQKNRNSLISAAPLSLKKPSPPKQRPASPRPPPLRRLPPPLSPAPQRPGSAPLKPGSQSPCDKYSHYDTAPGDTGVTEVSRRRRKNKFSAKPMSVGMDLDSLFEADLASINEVFQEFEVKDKKDRKRQSMEEEELKRRQSRVDMDLHVAVPIASLEEVSRRHSMDALTIERRWKEEMEALEREQLRENAREADMDLATDLLLQNLDNELKTLIQEKEEGVKVTQIEKVLRAQREKEEKERKEKERLERLSQNAEPQELTIEEWIVWMEGKKKAGMTPAQVNEYERRKEAWRLREKERAEKMRRENEEQKNKTRKKIDDEIRVYSRRSLEFKENRLTEDEIRRNFEELVRKNEQEGRQRRARGDKMREDDKQHEVEENTSKARSALAARWEESVKSRSKGAPLTREQHRATVLAAGKKADIERLERETERLTRRITTGFLSGENQSPDKQ